MVDGAGSRGRRRRDRRVPGLPEDPGPALVRGASSRSSSSQPIRWKALVKRCIARRLVAGVALYLVAARASSPCSTRGPSWPPSTCSGSSPPWWPRCAHFACTFSLQRIALRTKAWFPVDHRPAGRQRHLPHRARRGGGRGRRAVPDAGHRAAWTPTEAVGGLTAFSFLGIGGLLALPGLRPAGGGVRRPGEPRAWPTPPGSGPSASSSSAAFGAVVHGHGGPAAVGRAGSSRPCRNRVAQEAAPPRGAARAADRAAQRHPRRCSASSGGRPPCCRSAGCSSTTSACCSASGPWAPTPGPRSSCWPTPWPASSAWCPSPPGASASSRPASPGSSPWPASTGPRRCWPPWPTGWPPTGCPCWPARWPTAPSATATGTTGDRHAPSSGTDPPT